MRLPSRRSFVERSPVASHPLPLWLRSAMLIIISLSLVDDVRKALAQGELLRAGPPRELLLAGQLLSYVVLFLAVWRIPVAVAVAVPLLALSLVTHDYSGGTLAGLLLVALAPIETGRRLTAATWGLFLVWTVLASVLRGPHWSTTFWPALMIFFLAGVVGTAVRRFQVQQAIDHRRLALLQEENARIRDDERAALARELHDVVAHELSVISLQVTSRRRTDDPVELHRVLDSVYRSTHSALYELRLLVGLLRQDGPDEDDRLGHLSDDTSLVGVVRELGDQLTELGFAVRFDVPAEVDELPATLTRTLIRVLQEATTNIIKHAPPRCSCEGSVRLGAHDVELTVRNPLAREPVHDDLHRGPTGWGLRGAAERLDLLGGQLSAGADGPDWVVRARIPLAADEVA